MPKMFHSVGHRSGRCGCGCDSPSLGTPSRVQAPLSRRDLLIKGTAFGAFAPSMVQQAFAQARGPLEKKKLKIGFIPITCMIPLLAAEALGYFKREGLEVELAKTPSPALTRDKLLNGEYDASHLTLPQPMMASLGVGSPQHKVRAISVLNLHGNAIVLHSKHIDRQDPRDWKGFKFGIPFEHSGHNLILRYYLAEFGLDPDKDVSLRVIPPPDSVANLRSGNLDGMLFAEPWCQRAIFEGVGFYHKHTKEIFPNHPCCTLTVLDEFSKEMPNTYSALFRAIVLATNYVSQPENRKEVAKALSEPQYLNAPLTLLEQVLVGPFADGKGNVQTMTDRVEFKPIPVAAPGIWQLTQLKRWGYLKGAIDYQGIVQDVFQQQDAESRLAELGLPVPTPPMIDVMGKPFDPSRPEEYLASFAVRRNG